MMEFLTQNGGTILVGLLILVGVVLAVKKIIQDKKNGKSGCGGNCGGCPHSGICHKDTTL